MPAVGDVAALSGFLRGVPVAGDAHTAQVFVFDAQARLCLRTGDAPEPGPLAGLLAELARAA